MYLFKEFIEKFQNTEKTWFKIQLYGAISHRALRINKLIVVIMQFVNLAFKWQPTVHLWRHVVAQIIEALWYEPEGYGFDSRWYHLDFSLA